MSQRGARRIAASMLNLANRWGYIRTIVSFTLLMLIGSSLALIAEEPQAHTTQLSIRIDGTTRTVITTAGTVQAVLQQEGVALNQHDQVTPPVATVVSDGMKIVVARVTCEIKRERIPSPVATITRIDRRMTMRPVVLREGKAGVIERTRVIWKKDGVVSQQWTQNPRVIAKGTPRVVVRGNVSRGLLTGRVLTMHSTAYDPGPASCGKHADGYTAIGMRATRGVVAVDPRVIPLGTRVYVEGYGQAVAGDTGGAIKGNRIDVCFPTRGEALRWGRRTVRVIVLE